MKNKYFSILAIVLSCMNLLQSTAHHTYELHLKFLSGKESRTEHHINLTQMQRVIIATSREKMITVNGHQKVMHTNGLGLGDDNAKTMESFLSGETKTQRIDHYVALTQTQKNEIARNGFSDELLTKLEIDVNRSLLGLLGANFYSFSEARVPTGMQIEDGKLVVNCTLKVPQFRLKCELNYCTLALHGPWITKEIDTVFVSNQNIQLDEQGIVYESMEEIEQYMPRVYEYHTSEKIDGNLNLCSKTNDYTQVGNMLKDTYFLMLLKDRLEPQISRPDVLLYYLHCLSPFMVSRSLVYLKNHDDGQYSIGEIIGNLDTTCLYEVFFTDEEHTTRSWYKPEYSNPIPLPGFEYRFSTPTYGSLQPFPTCPDRGLILKSIKIAGKEYEFNGKLDIGYEPVYEYVIRTLFKGMKERLPNSWAQEIWNSINLEEACKPIERDISFIDSLAAKAGRESSDMIRLLDILHFVKSDLSRFSITEQSKGSYVLKVTQDQTLIYEIFFRDKTIDSCCYKGLHDFFLGGWCKQSHAEMLSIQELYKKVPYRRAILNRIKLGAETYSFNNRITRNLGRTLIQIHNAISTINQPDTNPLTQLEAKWNSIRLADIMPPIASLLD